MLHQHFKPLDRAACGLPVFNFAGFEFPRYVANLPSGSIAYRIEQHRRPAVTGGYYHAPTPNNREGWGFYLSDSGSQFALRWQWADEVKHSGIRHEGWYCDAEGDQTIRGIVLRLPHGRGFLAGWSMGEGMASSVDAQVYADAIEAAQAADEEARIAAENERDYQAAQDDEESDEG